MRIICSYCRKDLGDKAPFDSDLLTHGMCIDCAERYLEQWCGLSLGEYLDDFPFPVVVVNPEYRLIAANQRMADRLGRSRREIFGLLGGEAFECRYARLPEGCGNTSHCETCTIRRTVTHTMETGRPVVRSRAYLERDDGRIDLVISSFMMGDVVHVVVEGFA